MHCFFKGWWGLAHLCDGVDTFKVLRVCLLSPFAVLATLQPSALPIYVTLDEDILKPAISRVAYFEVRVTRKNAKLSAVRSQMQMPQHCWQQGG